MDEGMPQSGQKRDAIGWPAGNGVIHCDFNEWKAERAELLKMREVLHSLQAHPDWLYAESSAIELPPLGSWELNTSKGSKGVEVCKHYNIYYLRRRRFI